MYKRQVAAPDIFVRVDIEPPAQIPAKGAVQVQARRQTEMCIRDSIVATFGPDTLNILDNEPEKPLQIRGITEGKLKDIEESYAESRVLRNLMSCLLYTSKQKSYADAYAYNLTIYLHEIEEREGISILGQINDSLIDDNFPAPVSYTHLYAHVRPEWWAFFLRGSWRKPCTTFHHREMSVL